MSSKVTPEAIQEYRSGTPIKEILGRYDVSKTQFYRQLRKEITTSREQGPVEETWAKIVNDYGAGRTLRELADAYDTSVQTLSIGLKKRGVEIRRPSEYALIYTPEQKAQAIANYQTGMAVEKSGEFCGASYTTVYFWLEEASVPIRSQVVYGGDRDFFKSIDNERAAYWFGFLAADGHIAKRRYLRTLLSRKDRDHLVLFQQHLGHSGPIRDYSKARTWPNGRTKTYHLSRLDVCFARGCRDLIGHGLVEIKNGDPSKLAALSPEMLRHFLRGYFDGDGSIHLSGKKQCWFWYICAQSKPFLTALGTLMMAHGSEITRINVFNGGRREGQIPRLVYGGNQIVPRICRWLYKDATVYLDRKWKLAQEAING